jgi:hypothetical protein
VDVGIDQLEVCEVGNAAAARPVSTALITSDPHAGSPNTAFGGRLTSCNNRSYQPLILPVTTHEMNTYASQYPAVEFDSAYKKFFEEFYAASDTPDAHDDYVQYFTKDATLIMASKKVVGSEGSPPRAFRIEFALQRHSRLSCQSLAVANSRYQKY